jgi:hypothetical protein
MELVVVRTDSIFGSVSFKQIPHANRRSMQEHTVALELNSILLKNPGLLSPSLLAPETGAGRPRAMKLYSPAMNCSLPVESHTRV